MTKAKKAACIHTQFQSYLPHQHRPTPSCPGSDAPLPPKQPGAQARSCNVAASGQTSQLSQTPAKLAYTITMHAQALPHTSWLIWRSLHNASVLQSRRPVDAEHLPTSCYSSSPPSPSSIRVTPGLPGGPAGRPSHLPAALPSKPLPRLCNRLDAGSVAVGEPTAAGECACSPEPISLVLSVCPSCTPPQLRAPKRLRTGPEKVCKPGTYTQGPHMHPGQFEQTNAGPSLHAQASGEM